MNFNSLELDICNFLHFGFIPNKEIAESRLEQLCKLADDDSVETFSQSSYASAKNLLIRIVEDKLRGLDQVIIPLSAGYDSRGLLGATLEVLPADKIIGLTFGCPGTNDYERARIFTSGILKKHYLQNVDKLSSQWDTDRIIKIVSIRPKEVILAVGEGIGADQYKSVFSSKNCDDCDEIPRLNGFLGDSLSGKKLPKIISGRWYDAIQQFVRKNKAYKGSIDLTPTNYNPERQIPIPHCSARMITLDDQLDWCYRQEQRIRFFTNNYKNNKWAPYDDPRWWRSFIILDTKKRIDQKFYKGFLAKSFPQIFPDLSRDIYRESTFNTQKVKSNMHVDMDRLFQVNKFFRDFCLENIEDLKKRDVLPWLDLSKIMNSAISDPTGMGRPLYALASLEINFKTGHLPRS